MTSVAITTDNAKGRKIAYITGMIVLILIFAGFIFLLRLWYSGGAPAEKKVTHTSQTTTGYLNARAHTYGPMDIHQYEWLDCPPIDPSRQNISIHVVENDVWMDWMIDGRLYHEKPRYSPDHVDIKANGSKYSCRVTPGTPVSDATVTVTISEY